MFILLFFKNIYLAALGLSYNMWALGCSIWDLVPWPGIEPGPSALEAQSLSHWTTREVSQGILKGADSFFSFYGGCMNRAWWVTVQRVTKSQTQLRICEFICLFIFMINTDIWTNLFIYSVFAFLVYFLSSHLPW